jgi:hypothetical protein
MVQVRKDVEAGTGRSQMKIAISFILGWSFSQFLVFGGLTMYPDTCDSASLIDPTKREVPIHLTSVRSARTVTAHDHGPHDGETSMAQNDSPASEVVDTSNVQEVVTACTPISPEQSEGLKAEINAYEKSIRFQIKILEVQDKYEVAAHHVAIAKYLRENVLEAGWSILELGCAAGMMLQMVKRAYAAAGIEHKELVGVELVTGWVTFAQSYFTDIQVFEGEHTIIREYCLYSQYGARAGIDSKDRK